MKVGLLLQPCSDEERIGAALTEVAASASSVWLLSAWAQESGVDHLDAIVRQARSRGGRGEAILGLDQGIATYEGLQRALEVFDDVYLFHDGRRAFHPKLYAVETDSGTRLIVGSGNATEGGLFNNFEAAVSIDLKAGSLGDRALRDAARAYFDSFVKDGMPFRRLDSTLLDELRRERVVSTSSERLRADSRRRQQSDPALRKIFGASVSGLPTAPPRPRRRSGKASALPPVPSQTSVRSASSVEASWWKKLTLSDVMRKPSSSHQRKYVVLGKAGHPINKETYFKSHLFAGVAWASERMRTGKPKETAVVPFVVSIDGKTVLPFSLRIDHAENRIARQGNAPTYLNWSSLRDTILAKDYTGWYLVLERRADGTFALALSRQEPASAVIPPGARR